MNNDGFDMEDLDDEKTIAFIRERLPQDLKEKYSEDEFYFFLDTIYDYYDKSGILENDDEYNKMSRAANPYGDGTASKQIADILLKE